MRPPVVAAGVGTHRSFYRSRSPLALLLHPLHNFIDLALPFVLSVLALGRLLRALPKFSLRLGSLVNATFLAMKLRRRPPVVHTRHLPGELVEVGGGPRAPRRWWCAHDGGSGAT